MELVARVALSVTVFAGSMASARQTQDIESPRRFTVEKVILTDGDRDVCVADTTGSPELTPHFARTSSESHILVDLRACESSEVQLIQEMASNSVRKADLAGLKPFIKGAIMICGVTAALGITGGSTETEFMGLVAMTAPPTMMLKGAWWMGPKMAAGLSAAMLACGAGSYYGTKGLKYLMTKSSEPIGEVAK